jgi:hypothetical protein
MPMTRSGLSSLMGYAPGGIVGLEQTIKGILVAWIAL